MEKRTNLICRKMYLFGYLFLSVCFLLLLVCMGVTAQTNYKISGTVVAAKDSEPLIGVNVLQRGRLTDSYGYRWKFYSICSFAM